MLLIDLCIVIVEELKKPDVPLHIKLIVAILNRSLNFLPSKDRTRKLLVLEILSNGLEIIRDWENELLPIVHKIWSPFVDRFKEFDDPVVINYSFLLLVTLARLSKDFLRSRTAKYKIFDCFFFHGFSFDKIYFSFREVLPSILTVLNSFSKESYLKDKGSAYRYSQKYKLQLIILDKLAMVVIDLDLLDDDLRKTMDSVFKYLSDKQPVTLQVSITLADKKVGSLSKF